jgi:hypothetical protein
MAVKAADLDKSDKTAISGLRANVARRSGPAAMDESNHPTNKWFYLEQFSAAISLGSSPQAKEKLMIGVISE